TYSSVAILQQDDLQELAGHLRVTGTVGNDVLTIHATNANSGTWQLNDGPVNSFSDIENFTFVGLEGDDRLVINNPVDGVFHPAGGVDYIGGTGGETLGDTLEIIGGFVADSEFEFLTEDRGRVFYGGLAVPAINYFELEELVSELSVTEQQLYYNIPATLLSISDAGAGKTAFDTAFGTPLKLETPIETLSLQYGNRPLQGDQYYIHLNSLEAGFDANFVINDRHNNNSVILTDGLHLGSADVTINTETVRIFGSVTGTGDLEIVATNIDFSYANSMLNSGDLRLQAEDTINLMEVISTGTVEITSLNGDITDGNDSLNNIKASRAILSAVNGSIGSILETEIGRLEAVAGGIIEISNTGDLILGGIGALDRVESTGSDVIIDTLGRLEVQGNVTALNSITLTTLDSAVASLNEDIVVKSGATIYAANDEVALYADDDLTVEELAELLAPGYYISLNVNYDSADGVGGVLKLAGQTTTWSPFHLTLVNGSSQADTFQVAPSLNSLMSVWVDSPSSPDLIVDSLSYITPEGETGTLVPSGDTYGTISFTGGYRDIQYLGVENLQQADLQHLVGQLRIEGTADDDVLTINATDANSGTWQLNDGPAVAFSAIDDLSFYGLTGDDRLVINNPAGMIFNPVGGIVYDAGGQAGDELILAGGFANSEEHRLVAGQHAVYFNGSTEATIRYLGVSRIISELDTAETILTGDILTVSSSDGIQTSVTGDGTSVHFASLTGALSLQGDTDSATIQLNTLGSGLTGTLNSGGEKQDVLILNDGLDLGNRNLTFQSETVQIAGAVTRSGDLEIEATTIEFTSPDSSLNTGDGNLRLRAENSISLMEIITTGTVEINSINGDITDNGDILFSDGGATNITAANVLLSALNGMISSIDTQAGHLEAIADGMISINNTGNLVIGGAGSLMGVESLNGTVQIYSHGSIDIQEDIRSWDTCRIQTFDSAEASLSEDITVRSGAMVISTYSYVNLAADDDLTIESGSAIAAPNNDIHLRLDYLSADGAGTVLQLAGNLTTRESGGLSRVYGSSNADYLWVTPSLNSRIMVYGMAPDAPAVTEDSLFYVIPEEETATLNHTGNRLDFSGGYANITFSGIENLQQGDLQQLAGQLRIDGTA
ncbi:MAG: hypothetical protein KDA74_15415, partial [Planctomycetaceae bacterium]|nr:hypothetical protein [Planctomycetaceae bacterium]